MCYVQNNLNAEPDDVFRFYVELDHFVIFDSPLDWDDIIFSGHGKIKTTSCYYTILTFFL